MGQEYSLVGWHVCPESVEVQTINNAAFVLGVLLWDLEEILGW